MCLLSEIFCHTRPYSLLSDSAKEECAPESFDPTEDKAYDSVVVGLSPPHFQYDVLTPAFRILKREAPYTGPNPPPLIATHKGKYFSNSSNQLSLGPGPFVSALEYAADVQAIVVGKPTRTFFELVISSLDLPEDTEAFGKVAIIGDDVEADLGGGAVELGLWRVLGLCNLSESPEPRVTDRLLFPQCKRGSTGPGMSPRRTIRLMRWLIRSPPLSTDLFRLATHQDYRRYTCKILFHHTCCESDPGEHRNGWSPV